MTFSIMYVAMRKPSCIAGVASVHGEPANYYRPVVPTAELHTELTVSRPTQCQNLQQTDVN